LLVACHFVAGRVEAGSPGSTPPATEIAWRRIAKRKNCQVDRKKTMPNHKIRCEVVEILQNKFNCSKVGEVFVIGPRTPEGMCARAFAAVYPAALAMRFSDKMSWESDDGHIDVTCPDQDVVYRLTRME
jgi:uncharacterized repeat protein (TIGR04076 family)